MREWVTVSLFRSAVRLKKHIYALIYMQFSVISTAANNYMEKIPANVNSGVCFLQVRVKRLLSVFKDYMLERHTHPTHPTPIKHLHLGRN